MMNYIKSTTLVLLGLSQALAQSPLLLEPNVAWTNQVVTQDQSDGGVLKGNGVKVSPDGEHLIVTSAGGAVSSFSATTGDFEWEYNPPSLDGGNVNSHSQIVFTTPNAASPYMVYSIVENENSANPTARVVALDLDGNELWVSDSLDGVPNGSPVISDEGEYIFLTHNSAFDTVGAFSAVSASGEGSIFFTQVNETNPFAPPGIYHSPIEGNYDGEAGRNNRNDIIMWTVQPKPSDTTIQQGNTFAFQFPVDFGGNATEASYFLLGNPRNFQGTTAPTITNRGLFCYFGASRSNFFAWNGNTENGRGRFNRGPQGFSQFTRNPNFAGEPVFASPVVGGDETEPFVFGGSAAAEFVRQSFDLEEALVVPTESFIRAEARVDPFDRVVYYAEDSGLVHGAGFEDIQDIWTTQLDQFVQGEMAISSDGAYLYVADTQGVITALQVSEIPTPAPTTSPSASPTGVPTPAPTGLPTVSQAPTPAVTPAPTAATPAPTAATPAPTAEEVPVTEAPVAEPTEAPSGASQPMIIMTVASLVAALFM